ncbi:hypothetical protein [Polluticoccus soli]|uniref:hypothetical protein n=1 Tax=Polluticoccus soli TaxID=3034150 RepID=UPI0023E1FE32|nr:hypothetical protein [Flavipsychrobacter sp. JY13-12]
MDAEALRQEIQSFLKEGLVYKPEVTQAKVVSYLRSIDKSVEESTVVALLKDMAQNNLFRLKKNADGEEVVVMPSY